MKNYQKKHKVHLAILIALDVFSLAITIYGAIIWYNSINFNTYNISPSFWYSSFIMLVGVMVFEIILVLIVSYTEKLEKRLN